LPWSEFSGLIITFAISTNIKQFNLQKFRQIGNLKILFETNWLNLFPFDRLASQQRVKSSEMTFWKSTFKAAEFGEF